MNHSNRPDERAEREWQAQERALRDEREGAGASDEARVLRYRVLARALREPLPETLPPDFAHRVAALAEASNPVLATMPRFERVLAYAVLPVFALSAAAAVALGGGDWLQTLDSAHGAGNAWIAAAAACVAVSMAAQRFQPRRMR